MRFWIGCLSWRFSVSSFSDFCLITFCDFFLLFRHKQPLDFLDVLIHEEYLSVSKYDYVDALNFSERRSQNVMFLLTLSVYKQWCVHTQTLRTWSHSFTHTHTHTSSHTCGVPALCSLFLFCVPHKGNFGQFCTQQVWRNKGYLLSWLFSEPQCLYEHAHTNTHAYTMLYSCILEDSYSPSIVPPSSDCRRNKSQIDCSISRGLL